MKKPNILVIGSLNMDLVIRVPHMPAIGQTILGRSTDRIPGGKGANQAYAAAKLGGSVAMMGKVGQDEDGKTLVNNLRNAGVETGFIGVEPSGFTGIACIYVNDEGDNTIVVTPGANEKCDLKYIQDNHGAIEAADILLLQMEIPADAVYHAIRMARKYGKTVILNPAPAPSFIPADVLEQIDFLIPNETELQKLTGTDLRSEQDAAKAARTLIAKGVKNVIVTLGEKGALLVTREEAVHFPVPRVTAVDTTAAGDAFIAAFAVELSEGKACSDAISFANKVAAIVVTRRGAQTSIPDRREVQSWEDGFYSNKGGDSAFSGRHLKCD